MSKERCRAKYPKSCRVHGSHDIAKDSADKSVEEQMLREGSTQQKMFQLFKNINEDLKTELCAQGEVETVKESSDMPPGFIYKCNNCSETHYFTREYYDKTKGGKALTYMFKQLPPNRLNNQFLVPIQTLQNVALNESFTRLYANEDKKKVLLEKLSNRMQAAGQIKEAFDSIVVPSKDSEDWTPPYTPKEGALYVEPEHVPKELLYKFSQCLRKVPHESAESAAKSMTENGNAGKEVYACPHCKKYHYGRPIDPNRTEEERYEFVKKTWAMPAYRETISLLVQTYGLKN